MGFFSAILAVIMWMWADKKEAEDERKNFRTQIALAHGPRAAQAWNSFVSEHYEEDAEAEEEVRP